MMHTCSDPRAFVDRLRPGQLLEALWETVPEVYFFVKDRQGRFVTASRSFARILGADTVAEILGKTDFDFSADFLAEAFVADDQRVMTTGQTLIRKIELVPSGDSLDWLSTTKTPLYDTGGEVIGLAGICHVILESDAIYRDHPGMRQIITFLAGHFREKISTADMARAAGVSISSVERLFRNSFGVTPLMYLRKTRLNAACRMLREDALHLSAIAEACGFNDQSGMTRAFRQELKITPLKYRRRFSEASTFPKRNPTLHPA